MVRARRKLRTGAFLMPRTHAYVRASLLGRPPPAKDDTLIRSSRLQSALVPFDSACSSSHTNAIVTLIGLYGFERNLVCLLLSLFTVFLFPNVP